MNGGPKKFIWAVPCKPCRARATVAPFTAQITRGLAVQAPSLVRPRPSERTPSAGREAAPFFWPAGPARVCAE
eukprot:5077012-Heterocapsa_arctica.AAC.1